jgi:hypothetical protein
MLDDYQDLIDELLGTPQILRELLATAGEGVPAAVLARIADLRDRDRVVTERLQRMTREATPHLKALPDAATLAGQRTAAPGDAEALIASFDTARGNLVSLLMNLTLRDWSRTATRDVGDVVTLADEVERHVEFDEEQVERVREALHA